MGKKSRKLRSPKYAKKYAKVRSVVAALRNTVSSFLEKAEEIKPVEEVIVEEIVEEPVVKQVPKERATRKKTAKPKIETEKKPTPRRRRTKKKVATTKSEE